MNDDKCIWEIFGIRLALFVIQIFFEIYTCLVIARHTSDLVFHIDEALADTNACTIQLSKKSVTQLLKIEELPKNADEMEHLKKIATGYGLRGLQEPEDDEDRELPFKDIHFNFGYYNFRKPLA